MIRQTGGLAVGAISTRSSSAVSALARASARETIPSCSPSSPTKRISGAVMSALIRCCLSRAIVYSPMMTKNGHAPGARQILMDANCSWQISNLATRRDLLSEARQQGIERHGPQVLAAAGTHGHRSGLQFLVADDQLIRK